VNDLAKVRAQFRGASRNEIDAAILVAWKAALDSVKARQPHEVTGLGCGDGGCVIATPRGMHTNGGCHCEERALRRAVLIYRAECDRLTALLSEQPESK
jgi:hypothetical protein